MGPPRIVAGQRLQPEQGKQGKLETLGAKQLIEATGAKNRGVKESGFYVLKNTKSPAILIETGFISNLTECKKLFTTDYQQTIAKAIYNGIRQQVK